MEISYRNRIRKNRSLEQQILSRIELGRDSRVMLYHFIKTFKLTNNNLFTFMFFFKDLGPKKRVLDQTFYHLFTPNNAAFFVL